MPYNERTERDRVYIQLLKRHGEMTNVELRKASADHVLFKQLTDEARDKDVDRFVTRGEYLGIITKNGGNIALLGSHGISDSKPEAGQLVLHTNGFITSRAGLRCRHCMHLIDLTQVKIERYINSDSIIRVLHIHHFFWVRCPNCRVKARYDMNQDVKPILADMKDPSVRLET